MSLRRTVEAITLRDHYSSFRRTERNFHARTIHLVVETLEACRTVDVVTTRGFQLTFVQVRFGRAAAALAALSLLILPSDGEDAAAPAPVFSVALSANAGNDPYPYMERSGILKKWADRYHLQIKLERLDYTAAIDAFTAKRVDACVMSNMEALTSGIDTTVVYVNDSSNGNDMILARDGVAIKDLPNKRTLLAQKSVSLYLLERAMEIQGLQSQIPSMKLLDAPAEGIAAKFLKESAIDVMVSWKPMASQILAGAKAKDLFNSARIPGEIAHFMAVRTEVISRPDGAGDRFAKALTGAWYEVMSQMGAPAIQGQILTAIASASDNTLDSFQAQLSTTQFFFSPIAALHFENVGSKDKLRVMRQFCFNHKLLGEAQAPEDVAIEYPDKSIQGKADHVRLRLVSKYMALALSRML
jgi:NitT/TauT family transport system substrate-binding protein